MASVELFPHEFETASALQTEFYAIKKQSMKYIYLMQLWGIQLGYISLKLTSSNYR